MPRQLPLDPPRAKSSKIFLIWFGPEIPFSYELNILSWILHNPNLHIEIYVNDIGFGLALRERLRKTLMEERARRPGSVSVNHFRVVHYTSIPSAKANPHLQAELHTAHGNYAAASDIFRIYLLLEYGGMYVDCDIECKEPLPPETFLPYYLKLRYYQSAVGRKIKYKKQPLLNNDVMIATQGSFFLQRALIAINLKYEKILTEGKLTHEEFFSQRAEDLKDSMDPILALSGPLALTSLLDTPVNRPSNIKMPIVPGVIRKCYKVYSGKSWVPSEYEKVFSRRSSLKATRVFTRAWVAKQFHSACQEKDAEKTKYWVTRLSKDINTPNPSGFTPLHRVCMNGDLVAVRILIANGADNHQKDSRGRSPLHIACQQGHLELVTFLLERGANVNETDYNGNTPLHLAYTKGNFQIAILLLAKAAYPSKITRLANYKAKSLLTNYSYLYNQQLRGQCYGLSMMHVQACLVDKGDGHEIETFIRRLSFLSQTAWDFNGKVFNSLPDLIDEASRVVLQHNTSPLPAADPAAPPVESRRANVAKYDLHVSPLVEAHRILDCQAFLDGVHTYQGRSVHLGPQNPMKHINVLQPVELTRLGHTIYKTYGHILVVNKETLANHLKCILAFNQKHTTQSVALLLTGSNHAITLTTALKDNPTPVLVFNQNSGLNLYENISEAAAPIFASLFKTSEWHILSITAFTLGDHDLTQYPLQQGIDYTRAYNGRTAFYVACRNGHTCFIKKLLTIPGAMNHDTINLANSKGGWTPLHVACHYGYLDIAALLIKHGAEINKTNAFGKAPIHTACQHGHLELITFLLKSGAHVNHTPNGWAPLHMACQHGHLEVVQLLINEGADTNHVGPMGETPLSLAYESNTLSIVHYLIKFDANVNKPSHNGTTPLHIACQQGHLEVAQALIARGANPHIKSEDGLSPMHFMWQQKGN